MIVYNGMEIWADSHVPLREAPPKWKHFRWRLFWRFLGKPEPLGAKMFFVMKHPFEDREVCMMNPEMYAEIDRELSTVKN